MKAVVIRKPEGPDGLEIVTLPDPEPGPDEILVRMAAASITIATCSFPWALTGADKRRKT